MQPKLVGLSGSMQGEVIPMTHGEISLGRDSDNSVSVPDPMISRRHCAIRRNAGGQIEIQDHNSRNGTFVNGIPVKSRRLEHGDRIRIGSVEFQVLFVEVEPPQTPSAFLRHSPEGVTKTILQLRHQKDAILRPEEIAEAGSGAGQSLHYLKALFRLCGLIRTTGGMNELARGIMEALFDTIPASEAAFVLIEAGKKETTWSFGWRRASGPSSDVEIPSELVWQSIHGEVGILSSLQQDGDAGQPARSVLLAPLAGQEIPIGAVYLANTGLPASFDEEHLRLVTAIGRIAGLALSDAWTVDQLKNENRRLREEMDVNHGMVGDSQPMQRVYEFINKVAPSDSTVLITGESGTGKELVARAIHRGSERSKGPFVAINCAALAASLLESELFGHEKGAFTGALHRKPGKFELADGGTIFLDEIGELSAEAQAKLLRVLQERELERVGGTRPVPVNVRVIAATNRDLRELIRRQVFREDLYYRLDVVAIRIPPLRERREDLPLLAGFFAARCASRTGRKPKSVSPDAGRILAGYDWPGNVRELQNAIERAVVLGQGDAILAEDLPETLLEQGASLGQQETGYLESVRRAKQEIILRALESAGGNQVKAAAALGVHHTYLSRLIRGLDMKQKVAGLRHS
jgi:transcriptional regulator with GAF, ATPase, and Fis domain/pSer/pThr/pTyr-binding forkhead associated (FHA) protein